MFSLFNRKKKRRPIKDWELSLLANTLQKLPDEFNHLKTQVESGLFQKVLQGYSSFNPDYIAFSFNPDLINDFENEKEKDYNITNIRVSDANSNKMLVYTINVSAGVICGYSIKGGDNSIIDLNGIDASQYAKCYYDKNNEAYSALDKILNTAELKLINPGNVYEVILNGVVYYHIKDIEDGDFIGIDANKVLYKITHYPFEIIPLSKSLEQV